LKIKGLTHIDPYIKGKKDLKDENVQEILGMSPDKGLNPLFADTLVKLESTRAEKKLSIEASKKCDRSVVNLWISYHKTQADWTSSGLSKASFIEKKQSLDEQTLKSEKELLDQCRN
jgi:hypothetical protein